MADDTLLAPEPVDTDPAPVSVDPAPAGDPPSPPAGDPPAPVDDWRARLAGEDKKLLGYLSRVPSEKALVEQLKTYNDDIKAGKYIKPLGDNPTDEDLAAWKKALGVPETPEGYLEKLPEGLVVGDEDKPFVEEFAKAMFGANASPQQVNAALETYYGIVEDQMAAEAEAADAMKNESVEVLRSEWGADYRRNLNVMHGYLDTLPEEVANAFRAGKDAEGRPLGYNAEVLRWLTAQAMKENPVATVVPGAGANQADAIASEIAALEAKMGDRQSDYWKGPTAAKNQARYLELVEARAKLGNR